MQFNNLLDHCVAVKAALILVLGTQEHRLIGRGICFPETDFLGGSHLKGEGRLFLASHGSFPFFLNALSFVFLTHGLE